MPHGKGTYGSKVGRPSKKDKQKRKPYITGGSSGSVQPQDVSKAVRYATPIGQADMKIDRAHSLLRKVPILGQVTGVLAKVTEAVAGIQDDVVETGTKIVLPPPPATTPEEEEEDRKGKKKPKKKSKFRGGKIRKLYQEGGKPSMEDQMEGLAISVEPITVEKEETHTMPDGTVMPGATHEEYEEQMLPDEEMEEDYVDFVVSSTLDQEDKNYLESALAEDAKLSELFDQVVESASEFSGSGPIEGPGTEVSDSIPARLSDGEFVFTAKATEEIGEDSLMSMMKDAEAAADERQGVAYGGVIDEEDQAVPIQTRGSVAAQGNVPNVVKQSRQVEEEMLKSSPRRYYVPVSG